MPPFEMSVRNGPAEIVLTRTFGPYSRANDTVIALSAAFAEPYGTTCGNAMRPPDEETLMMAPPSAAAMRCATWLASRNGPLKLRPTILSNRSSLTSWLGTRGPMPALLTRMSTRPNSA